MALRTTAEPRTYETILITKVDMPEDGFASLIEKCTNIIKNDGKGEVLMTDDWKKAKIAFPIMKEPRGQWTYFRYKSLPAGVDELQRNLRINEFVLRQFTARADESGSDYATLRDTMPKELADRERRNDWKEERPRRSVAFKGRGGARRDQGAPRADSEVGTSPYESETLDTPEAEASDDGTN
jgi:ribosomal protein S6